MIINFTGQAGSGKTAIANELIKILPNSISIDSEDLKDKENSLETTKTAYEIALFLEKKDFLPIISLISPYKDLREELKEKTEVFECHIFTSEKENFFTEGYEKPDKYFLPIDTKGREAVDIANEVSVLIKNKIFKNIVVTKQQKDL